MIIKESTKLWWRDWSQCDFFTFFNCFWTQCCSSPHHWKTWPCLQSAIFHGSWCCKVSWLVYCWLLQEVQCHSTWPNLWHIILWPCCFQALCLIASSPIPPPLFEYDKGGEMNWFYLVYFKTGFYVFKLCLVFQFLS